VLVALLALSACTPGLLRRHGALALGGDGPQGRTLARSSAVAAAQALGDGGGLLFVARTNGVDLDIVSLSSFGPAPADAQVTRTDGGWIAEATIRPRDPASLLGLGEALTAVGVGSASDPSVALGRAETQARADLVRQSLAAQGKGEGVFTGRLLLVDREVLLERAQVTVRLTGHAVLDAPAPLAASDRCRLPLATAFSSTGRAQPAAATAFSRIQSACPVRVQALADQARAEQSAGHRRTAARLLKEALQLLEPAAVVVDAAVAGADDRPAPVTRRPVAAPPAGSTTTTALAMPTPTTRAPPGPPCPSHAVLVPGGALVVVGGEPLEVSSFCLDRTEAWPGYPRGPVGRRASSAVTWNEADAACRAAGGRLPTEAEWVFAASGPEGRKYPWGNESPDCERANSGACGGADADIGVATAGATPLGIFELGGNLREWVADRWNAVPFQRGDHAKDSKVAHVLRGGGWGSPAAHAATDVRDGANLTDDFRDATIGFRCAYGVRGADGR
jgi:hypothetical protein